ncbi:MAG: DUF2207 domain-containing protein [Candidatus Korobacteraceae bacterium]|jgi:uncharacterized membrane protein YgcG
MMRRFYWLSWASLLLILLAVVSPVFAFPGPAVPGVRQRPVGRSWRIAEFHSNLSVMPDGAMLVTEDITAVFTGEYRWISRSIPIEYPGPNGTNYTLFLKIGGVTDENQKPLKYETGIQGAYRYLKIYLDNAFNTDKTVRITYTVQNGVRFFDDHDELYWNVTGNDWPVPIDNASALVVFPASASGSLRAQAFTGAYGSAERDAQAEVTGNQVTFETNNPLPMRGGLTLDVYVPKGFLHQPGPITRALWFVRSNAIVLLPVFAFIVMFTMWWFKGRDPKAGLSVAPMYEPPKGMSPGEVGSLVDDSVLPRDITSTLVDLAVRGYLKIEEQSDKALFFNSTDYVFHLMKPPAEWNDLADHEVEILRNMFPEPSARLTTLSGLKNRFYLALPSVKQEILGELKSKGMYRVDPESAHGYRLVGILIIALPFIGLQAMGVAQFFLSPLVAIISIAMALLIVFLFGREMTAKTLRGVRTVVEIQGFKEFMTRVDADRLKRMPPDTFEKFLPYAMALGVEKHWAHAFEGIIHDPPSWYVGPQVGLFNPIFFTHSMYTMTNSAYEAFSAAPRASSTGSGFSGGGGFGGGGGFSGGGFGGGGGDAG